MTIKVKPLNWVEVSTYFGGVFNAGQYRIVQWLDRDLWTINCLPGEYATPEAAKAFAEAHHEASIRSQIEEVSPATIRAEALRDKIAAKAREYAEHYPQSSDGRNTFLMFAEWVETLEEVSPATIRAEALREALIQIDALDPEGFTESCSDFAIRGLVNRMGKIARDALALIDKEQDQ